MGAVKGRSGFVDLTFTLSKIICATLGGQQEIGYGMVLSGNIEIYYLFIYLFYRMTQSGS